MILNVCDLWPKSAVSMGVLRNKVLIKIALALENYIYEHSHAIAGQTEAIVQYIRTHTADVQVELITNGVDPKRFATADLDRQERRAHFGFANRFVLGFTGLHGLAYDIDGILRTAKMFQRKNASVLF